MFAPMNDDDKKDDKFWRSAGLSFALILATAVFNNAAHVIGDEVKARWKAQRKEEDKCPTTPEKS